MFYNIIRYKNVDNTKRYHVWVQLLNLNGKCRITLFEDLEPNDTEIIDINLRSKNGRVFLENYIASVKEELKISEIRFGMYHDSLLYTLERFRKLYSTFGFIKYFDGINI